jgi:hypothetical protein
MEANKTKNAHNKKSTTHKGGGNTCEAFFDFLVGANSEYSIEELNDALN